MKLRLAPPKINSVAISMPIRLECCRTPKSPMPNIKAPKIK